MTAENLTKNPFEWSKLEDVVKSAYQKHGKIFCVKGGGNNGDTLIYMGAEHLLAKWKVEYEILDPKDIPKTKGKIAVLFGGGGFCKVYHYYHAKYLKQLKENFGEVIVFPTAFDPEVEAVFDAVLPNSKCSLKLFCRDPISQIKLIQKGIFSYLAHDTAFALFDSSWIKSIEVSDKKELVCFREDGESSGNYQKNDCISVSFDEYVKNIAEASCVKTDRLHVAILSAMLGKKVDLYPSNYHKILGVYLLSLSYFDNVKFHG